MKTFSLHARAAVPGLAARAALQQHQLLSLGAVGAWLLLSWALMAQQRRQLQLEEKQWVYGKFLSFEGKGRELRAILAGIHGLRPDFMGCPHSARRRRGEGKICSFFNSSEPLVV